MAIKIGERLFKHLTQTRVVGVLQLLENPVARKPKAFDLPDSNCFLGRKFLAGRLLVERGFGLLFFY